MGEVVDLEAERKARAEARTRREKLLRDAEGVRLPAPEEGRPDDSDPTRPGRGGESSPR